MGPGAQDRRAQPVAAVLCGAALWRRAGRGDADGAIAGAFGQSHHRHEGAGEERSALSDRTLWYSERRARRHGRFLRQEIGSNGLDRHCEERSDEAIHLSLRDRYGLLRFARNDKRTQQSPQEIRICLRRNSTSLSMAPPASPASSSPNIWRRITGATVILNGRWPAAAWTSWLPCVMQLVPRPIRP